MGKNDRNNRQSQQELTTVMGEDGAADMALNNTEVLEQNKQDDNQDTTDNSTDNLDNVNSDEIVDTESNGDNSEDKNGSEDDAIVDNGSNVEQPIIPEDKSDETDNILEDVKEEVSFGSDIKVLNDSSISVKDKIKWALTEAPSIVKKVAIQLESYRQAMSNDASYNEELMVGKQYQLLGIYRDLINTTEYKDFKIKLDVINLFMINFKDDAFGSHKLSRFDYLWKWTKTELETLLNLSEVISQLCIYPERATRLKQLNLDMSLDKTKTIVTEEARQHFLRYYK